MNLFVIYYISKLLCMHLVPHTGANSAPLKKILYKPPREAQYFAFHTTVACFNMCIAAVT